MKALKVTWYVGFRTKRMRRRSLVLVLRKRGWRALLDELQMRGWLWTFAGGWEHCYAFASCGGAAWVVVQPMTWRTDVVLFSPETNVLEYFCGQGDIVVQVSNRSKPGFVPRYVPMTCVSVVKSLLGLRSRAFTPKGLFAALTTEYGGTIYATEQTEQEHGQSFWRKAERPPAGPRDCGRSGQGEGGRGSGDAEAQRRRSREEAGATSGPGWSLLPD